MASARKRPRAETEDNRAECPYSVKVVDPKDKDQKKKKRRRTDGGEDDDTEKKLSVQLSPFAPNGKFKTHDTLDLHYRVDPIKKWTEMTRYNSFVLNGVKYFSEGFIYVANDSSIERQKSVGNSESTMHPRKKSDDDWVARILEIRASDEHHVYARVYWMYWPDELPQGSLDGKKYVSGRQAYHGANELIASNHMDIINVVSVTSPATVKQWNEDNDDEIQSSLYWRQAFDVRTYELSTVEPVCSCKTPEHPDKIMVGCTSDSCHKWMHEQCIKDDALKITFQRLGTDKPHQPPNAVKQEKDDEEAKRPLSPTETGAGMSTQHSIDVKSSGDGGPSDGIQVNADNVEVKQADDEDALTAPEDGPSQPANAQDTAENARPETPSKGAPKVTAARKVGRPKRKSEANGDASKPWEGLFDVTLNMESTPPRLEFKDLRDGIKGGEKAWTEPIRCLVYGSEIN